MRIDSLQAGRAFAALAVVAHHANLAAHDFGRAFIPVLELGWLGVDFFFVLSGFIISWTAPGKSAREFAWHRFRRVVLPYWPIGVGMALLYTFLPGVSGGVRDWSWLTTLTLLPIDAEPALSVAWTLQHEMLFYALFLLFWFSGRFALGLGLWAALIGLALLLGIDWLALHPINLEFLFGVAACWAVRRGIEDWRLALAALVPLALWWWLGLARPFSPLAGLALALALPWIIGLERTGRLRVPRFLSWLGETSYSLYLAHGLAIAIVARLLPELGLLFAAGVAGGLAYYVAVERPILRRVGSALPSRFAPRPAEAR